MARARYCVTIGQLGEDDFIYTYYGFAPSFYLARSPTLEEKLAFVKQLAERYDHRALSLKPFKCIACGLPACKVVDWVTYALHDPGCLAVNNALFPICQDPTCAKKAEWVRDAYIENEARRKGLKTIGPEIQGCRTCFRNFTEELPCQTCARCKAMLYCSAKCQQLNWRWHKRQCKGRVEAAKLTSEQLEQLDTLISINTGGTMEFPSMNHAGKLPPSSMQAGLGDLLDLGQDAAMSRDALHKSLLKAAKAKASSEPVPVKQVMVTPEQMQQLEGVNTQIFRYFGATGSAQWNTA